MQEVQDNDPLDFSVRPGVLVAHIPAGTVLDPRTARLFGEARRRLGRSLTEDESRKLLVERAKLN